MTIENLEDLLVQELSDVYSAEKQLTRALPKMAKLASNGHLADLLENHLMETKGQIERLEHVIKICGIKQKRKKCIAMEGIINEGNEMVAEMGEGVLRDAAIITAARKVEHYEISCYLSLMKLTRSLGNREAFELLAQTLEEEENADENLSYMGNRNLREYHVDERERRAA